MSIDLTFYLEEFRGGKWMVPDSLIEHYDSRQEYDRPSKKWILVKGDFKRVKYIVSVNFKGGIPSLFLGEYSPFKFFNGTPDDISEDLKEKCEWCEKGLGVWWLKADELMIEEWKTSFITIGNRTEARFAKLFGNGEQKLDLDILDVITEPGDWHGWSWCAEVYGYLVEKPIDWIESNAYKLYEYSDERFVDITWKSSIWDYLNKETRDSFAQINKFGNLENMRLVACAS